MRFFVVPMLLVLLSCSPKLSVDWTADDFVDRSFSKIAVVGINKNLKARVKFEETAVELFRKRGINAIEGIGVFPANMTKEEQSAANYIELVKENEVDAVITMSLVDTQETTKYEGGENYIVPAGYSRFGKYYVQRYATVHSPGYYVTTKEYLIEAVLYDLRGELFEGKKTLVWKGQSSLVEPSSIESAAKSYTKNMVGHLLRNKIIIPNQ